ncbi:bifunctional salicylyl-CoA 5-hydroxylase/oxidoreductase [Vibrio sp. vnigr-6D03]|uniref:bifunctional salicylyl-CoA 5-hydroxylase/oxidoreductase n=1 Tax=Vibrio sp. vnigr-6D03 TaxID=2058088 RepID=UPI000C338DFC|nr:bifunctional salicylyl-CoA 5-hydroxylase/oxidoreductase [Vibrio sp. vnigr-6D03]PKF76292.1 bifunctional salicylyl-CoA 5-hydroxylase/oxidoreductase [Vibrio sp. vnigr-6D03]
MRVACIGGGPGGLYFAISMKLRNPESEVVIFERHRADDTFGWGVVFSAETLDNFAQNDPSSAEAIRENFAYWDDIALVRNDEKIVSTGHGFCGIGRLRLLNILQKRAEELGIEIRYATESRPAEELAKEYDLVVASDGLNSKTRQAHEAEFKPNVEMRPCKFVWLGTPQKFDDAFTFIFVETDKGWVWAHAYQFDDEMATFIVECDEETWQNYGFGELSQQESIEVCQEIFKDHLSGQPLITNANHIRGSAWINFPRLLCEKWSFNNIVLMGDASASAHFSIGSGTKLAMESAIALATYLNQEDSIQDAFQLYESERREQVLRIQSAAINSLEWFEHVHRYLGFDLEQLNYAMLTRSQRIGHENLRMRDPNWLADAEAWFCKQAGGTDSDRVRSPMFTSFSLRDLELVNRVVVSPIAQYKSSEGHISDWHLIHYGERAKGGAGLVCSEMVSVSEDGRPTLGCAGLYHDSQIEGWNRVNRFVHKETQAATCCQLGHAGARAATQLPWEAENQPLNKGGWPLKSASNVPWSPSSETPEPLSEHDMDTVCEQFVLAARRAERAGFDMLEIHAGHGGLLASFISPLTNLRDDQFGRQSLENRMRFPLRVVTAVRQAWPRKKPMSVRISASDWSGDKGVTPNEAVDISAMLKQVGVDIIVVSSGETTSSVTPRYGRLYQTPFADQIRNEADISTMAVGNIYEADHVNSILLAGRADLVAIGRPHLSDPYWTNRQAAQIQDKEQAWPSPYQSGKEQLQHLVNRELANTNLPKRES